MRSMKLDSVVVTVTSPKSGSSRRAGGMHMPGSAEIWSGCSSVVLHVTTDQVNVGDVRLTFRSKAQVLELARRLTDAAEAAEWLPEIREAAK